MRMLAVKKHDLASVARQRQVRGRCAGPGAGRAALPPARAERMNTTVLCQTVALGWSRCDPRRAPDAARRAQALLEALADLWGRQVALDDGASHRLRDVTPANTQLLNHVLTAWSKARDADAAERAAGLLDRVAASPGRPFPPPDTISYNNLLHLYARRGDVAAAEALLRRMEAATQPVTGSGACTPPDVYSYSIVMNALQRRFAGGGQRMPDPADPERAEELLARLATGYEAAGFRGALRPSRVTF